MTNLTKTQQLCLDTIKLFIADHSYPPTTRELSVLMGFTSQGARTHIHALELKGYIERDTGISRGMRVLNV
jgi:SOS-response transcriptional repressor LexA